MKGALFARYSRYPGTLRRLFLDEFADSVPEVPAIEGAEGERAAELYERIFLGYGDDSVAQLGGAHIACEWTSNLLTKILQRPRLAAYLEQSTRYIAYDDAARRATATATTATRASARRTSARWTTCSRRTRGCSRACRRGSAERFPAAEGESPAAHRRAVRAKALDLVRGLLPAASLSHVGIYASGQTYEQLVLHLLAHPLAEARAYGAMLLEELQHIIPSFVVARAARGPRRPLDRVPARAARRRPTRSPRGSASSAREPEAGAVGAAAPRARHARRSCSPRSLYESSALARRTALRAVAALAGGRARRAASRARRRRARTGATGRAAASRRSRYRFEIVSDYGAFRDLQRHRLLTCQWQRLSPDLGADVPHELVAAGLGGEYERALDVSRGEYERLRGEGLAEEAPYALCLAYRIRYVLELDAREALHLIELRSGREGHPSYRAVAHEMRRAIADVHPNVAAAMTFVDDSTEERLERLLSRDAERSAVVLGRRPEHDRPGRVARAASAP